MKDVVVSDERTAALIAFELEQRKKNLDWFDYQERAGRWQGKSAEELKQERQDILDEISSLEKELSCKIKDECNK